MNSIIAIFFDDDKFEIFAAEYNDCAMSCCQMLPIIIQQTDLKRSNIDSFPSLAKCREMKAISTTYLNWVDDVLMDNSDKKLLT